MVPKDAHDITLALFHDQYVRPPVYPGPVPASTCCACHSRFKHSGHLLHCDSHVHLTSQLDVLVEQISWHLLTTSFAVVGLSVNLAAVDLSATGAVGGFSMTLAVDDTVVITGKSDSNSGNACANYLPAFSACEYCQIRSYMVYMG